MSDLVDEEVKTMSDEEFDRKYKQLVSFTIESRYGKQLNKIKQSTGFEREDLVQLGKIGIIKARDNFDPSRGYKFSTYAVPMIVGEIGKELRSSNVVKISRSVYEIKGKIMMMKLQEKSPKEIADILGVSEKLAKEALEYDTYLLSLNYVSFRGESKDVELGEMIVDEESYVGDIIDNKEILDDFFSTLEDRERMAWHLVCERELGQVRAGKILGISQVTVSRLISKVFRKAEEYGKRNGLQL